MRRFLIGTALMLALGAGASSAEAAGVALDAATELDAQAQSDLGKAIAAAKVSRPAAFARVASLRLKVAELDANKRGRLAAISPILKGMGPDALMPMLEELAVDAAPRGTLRDTAWRAWRLGLLEAVGALRDPRATEVLSGIVLRSPAVEYPVLRAASQALAKLNSDEAASRLIAAADQADGDDRLGILAGMGHCRRIAMATYLATQMQSADASTAHVLARSLGDLGNAWAWETPFVQQSGEEKAVRGTAAAALVDAFATHHRDDALRKHLTQAILVVDDASTPTLIAAARKGAGAELNAALDALELRLANSPLQR